MSAVIVDKKVEDYVIEMDALAAGVNDWGSIDAVAFESFVKLFLQSKAMLSKELNFLSNKLKILERGKLALIPNSFLTEDYMPEELVEKAKAESREKGIPTLIKRGDKFSVYGSVNGLWQERELKGLNGMKQKILAAVFEKKGSPVDIEDDKVPILLKAAHDSLGELSEEGKNRILKNKKAVDLLGKCHKVLIERKEQLKKGTANSKEIEQDVLWISYVHQRVLGSVKRQEARNLFVNAANQFIEKEISFMTSLERQNRLKGFILAKYKGILADCFGEKVTLAKQVVAYSSLLKKHFEMSEEEARLYQKSPKNIVPFLMEKFSSCEFGVYLKHLIQLSHLQKQLLGFFDTDIPKEIEGLTAEEILNLKNMRNEANFSRRLHSYKELLNDMAARVTLDRDYEHPLYQPIGPDGRPVPSDELARSLRKAVFYIEDSLIIHAQEDEILEFKRKIQAKIDELGNAWGAKKALKEISALRDSLLVARQGVIPQYRDANSLNESLYEFGTSIVIIKGIIEAIKNMLPLSAISRGFCQELILAARENIANKKDNPFYIQNGLELHALWEQHSGAFAEIGVKQIWGDLFEDKFGLREFQASLSARIKQGPAPQEAEYELEDVMPISKTFWAVYGEKWMPDYDTKGLMDDGVFIMADAIERLVLVLKDRLPLSKGVKDLCQKLMLRAREDFARKTGEPSYIENALRIQALAETYPAVFSELGVSEDIWDRSKSDEMNVSNEKIKLFRLVVAEKKVLDEPAKSSSKPDGFMQKTRVSPTQLLGHILMGAREQGGTIIAYDAADMVDSLRGVFEDERETECCPFPPVVVLEPEELDPTAAYDGGQKYESAMAYGSAERYYALAAEAGLAEAQYRLAKLYERGLSSNPNAFSLTLDYYLSAIKRCRGRRSGLPIDIHYSIGKIYAQGGNYLKACSHYQEAIGYAPAIQALGELYEAGYIPTQAGQDRKKEARKSYVKANEAAQKSLAENSQDASNCLEMQRARARAHYCIGRIYEEEGNLGYAENFYNKANEALPEGGYAPAELRLGLISEGKKLYMQALEHYTRAVSTEYYHFHLYSPLSGYQLAEMAVKGKHNLYIDYEKGGWLMLYATGAVLKGPLPVGFEGVEIGLLNTPDFKEALLIELSKEGHIAWGAAGAYTQIGELYSAGHAGILCDKEKGRDFFVKEAKLRGKYDPPGYKAQPRLNSARESFFSLADSARSERVDKRDASDDNAVTLKELQNLLLHAYRGMKARRGFFRGGSSALPAGVVALCRKELRDFATFQKEAAQIVDEPRPISRKDSTQRLYEICAENHQDIPHLLENLKEIAILKKPIEDFLSQKMPSSCSSMNSSRK